MKTKLLFLISLLLGFAATASAAVVNISSTYSPTTPQAEIYEPVFVRNLNIGSSGQDVMALKQILASELGVVLDKTATYTTNTAKNVKAFQEKYALEILIPNGLSSGTGIVGPSTTGELNILAKQYYIKLSDFKVPIPSLIKDVFTATLKLGSQGDEVSLLRVILNSDKDTKIIAKQTDATDFFDLATQDAVIRFQEKYSKAILAPSGLTQGTGVVGPATRKKLNSVLNSILLSAQTSNASTTASSSSPVPANVITY